MCKEAGAICHIKESKLINANNIENVIINKCEGRPREAIASNHQRFASQS